MKILQMPSRFKDPSGLFCEYEDDAGDGVLEEVDNDSNASECSDNGGDWYPDGTTTVGGNVGDGNVGLTGVISGGTSGAGSGPSGSGFQSTPPAAKQPGCPGATLQKINAVALNLFVGSQLNLAMNISSETGFTTLFGVSASFATGELQGGVGRAGSGQAAIAVDPAGNIGLLFSLSGGVGVGAGWTVGGDLGVSRAPTIWDMAGPSFSGGVGGGDGIGGAVSLSNNGGGTVTGTAGESAGGYGYAFTWGPTKVIPLVCVVGG